MQSPGIIFRGRKNIFTPLIKALAPAVALLVLIEVTGCKKPSPPQYLLRYQFQPGELLQYDISLRGEGTVTMQAVGSKPDQDKLVLPVQIEGSYLLEAAVQSLSPEGAASIAVSYKDFNLTMINRVRDREMTTILTDRTMRTEEGDVLSREITADTEGFPLSGIEGKIFTFEIDPRGRIISAQLPPDPSRAFPYLKFDGVMERIQPEFPETAIPVGAGWSREVKIPNPGAGTTWDRGETWTIRLDSAFRGFKGEGERIALIDFVGRYEQGSVSEEGGKSGVKWSSHLLTGTVEFDIKDGVVINSRSRLEQSLVVLLAIERVVPGKNLQARVKDTTEITVTLNPASRRR